MLLTAANRDVEWQPVRIDHGVDFCRQPSTGTSKGFAYIGPDAARVLMCANYCAINHLNFGIVPVRDSCQDAIPNSSVTPSNEPIVAGGVAGRSALVDHAMVHPTARPKRYH